MKRIIFVRHGESEANVSRVRMESEPNLTQKGYKQATAVSEQLLDFDPEIILHSPMKRARQTAYTIADVLDAPVKEFEQVRERKYPAFVVGLDKDSRIAKEYYHVYKRLWGSESELDKTGESFDEFISRIAKAKSILESLPHERIVVVSHGFFMKAFLAYILFENKVSFEHVFAFYDKTKIANAGTMEYVFDQDKLDWKLVAWTYLKSDSYEKDKNLEQKDYPSKKDSSNTKRPKIVTIGGGTGQYTLLSGLKNMPVDITAIVSTADSGGTTGVLRDELGVLPPTDFRKCLIALSNQEPILRELFSYRFPNKNLQGHTIGNLLITALEKVTGSFTEAMQYASEIFKIKGKVLPVTQQPLDLLIRLRNGEVLSGEDKLDDNLSVKKYGIERIYLKHKAKLNPQAKQAIKEADLIVIGPGDLYGSILPNFLVDGLAEAVSAAEAKKVFVLNLTNKQGQTTGFDSCKYIKILHEYAQEKIVDIVLCNSSPIPADLLEKYKAQEGQKVEVECRQCPGVDIIKADLLANYSIKTQQGDTLAHTRSFIRHDPEKLTKKIYEIARLYTQAD